MSQGGEKARELRQRGAECRCCIPALAGFVRLQSIVPGTANIERIPLLATGNQKNLLHLRLQ